jgi:uncharacterized protein YhfF
MFPVVNGMRSVELGFPGEQRARLLDCVLRGRKRATAGLMDEYLSEDEPLETIGEQLALVDDDVQCVGVIEITDVTVRRFDDVPWEFADAEGEGFTSVEDWRDGHRRHWAREGYDITGDTQVVCLSFDLL